MDNLFYNASDLFAKSGFFATDEAWMVEKKDGGEVSTVFIKRI